MRFVQSRAFATCGFGGRGATSRTVPLRSIALLPFLLPNCILIGLFSLHILMYLYVIGLPIQPGTQEADRLSQNSFLASMEGVLTSPACPPFCIRTRHIHQRSCRVRFSVRLPLLLVLYLQPCPFVQDDYGHNSLLA
jgi:hypothetical protein